MIRIGIIFILLFLSNTAFAQINVKLLGTIVGEESELRISADGRLFPINLSGSNFEIEFEVQYLPFPVSVVAIKKKSYVSHLTPTIWLHKKNTTLHLDVTEEKKGFVIDEPFQWQGFSEIIEKSSIEKQVEIIRNNLDKIPSHFFLYTNRKQISISDITQIYSDIDDKKLGNPYFNKILAYVEAKNLANPKKGSGFKSFMLTDKGGNMHNVMAHPDKLTVVGFMSSACFFSLSSIPELSQLSKQHRNNLNLVTIWDDNDFNTFAHYKSEAKRIIDWTNLWDKEGFAFTYFDIIETPTFYLISSKGEIIDQLNGTKKLEKKVMKFINQ